MPLFRGQSERPIAQSAKLMHEVFVKERSKNGFNPDRFFIPMSCRSRFKDRSHLYCEAIVLYTLIRERNFDPVYEELIFEYEKIICLANPIGEAVEKIEKIKSAVSDIATSFRESVAQTWAWHWFEAIGYRNASPIDLTLLLSAFSTTARGVEESLQKMSGASLHRLQHVLHG